MGQGNQDKSLSKCDYQFNGKPKAVPAPATTKAVVGKPTKAADAITIAQVRDVAQLVTLVGGFDRCHELLGVIRDVGGLRRMKDLLEALAAAQVSQSKV